MIVNEQGIGLYLVVITACYKFEHRYLIHHLGYYHLVGYAARVREDVLRLHMLGREALSQVGTLLIAHAVGSVSKHLVCTIFVTHSHEYIAYASLGGRVAYNHSIYTVARLHLAYDIGLIMYYETLGPLVHYPLLVYLLQLVYRCGGAHLYGTA